MSITTHKLQQEYHQLNLWYFISFICGIIYYFQLNAEPSIQHVILTTVFSFSTLYLKRYNYLLGKFVSHIIIGFFLGIAASKFRQTNVNTVNIQQDTISQVSGVIQTLNYTTRGIQVTLSAVDIDRSLLQPQKVRINIPTKYLQIQDLMVGDYIQLLAKLYPPRRNVVPGGYDFGFYAYFEGIGATGYAMAAPHLLSKYTPKYYQNIILNIRHIIYKRLLAVIGQNRGNFAAALLIGETHGIDKKIMQDMRQSGISHILCVSGLHLSLAAFIFFVTSRFILNLWDYIAFNYNIKLIAAICALIGSYGYLLLSGVHIAATRAFIMTAIFIIAIIITRTPCSIRSIAVAAAIILCLNPEYVFHPSFQLSFIAVLILISGHELYLKYQSILGIKSSIFSKVKFYLAANVYSSFLASTFTAPIVINQFYIFSVYSIPMNMIAVPIMSFFLMPLSILSATLMPLGIDYYPIKFLGFFIDIIIKAADKAVTLPGAVWYFGRIHHWSLSLFLFGLAWACIWQTTWRKWGMTIMLLAFITMYNTTKPDLIIDYDLQMIGIKNKNSVLEIYSSGVVPKFNRQYWANWFGQADATVMPLPISMYFKTQAGQNIHIMSRSNKCALSDITVNLHSNTHCKSSTLNLNAAFLNKAGIIALFCHKTKGCNLQYDNTSRFNGAS